MRVRGVVPDVGQGRRWAVEDNLAPNENESFHESLDGSELVRDGWLMPARENTPDDATADVEESGR